jgi:site-specific recombinase XerD
MSLQRDLADFLLYCELTKQYSANTIRNYKNTLERFGKFMEGRRIFRTRQIDLDLINDYRKYLSKKESSRHGEISQKAQAYQIVVIRSFLKFMIKNGALVLNPEKLELPKSKMRRIEYLTDEEVKKLVGAIVNDTSKKVPMVQKLRNQALIMVMFSAGLRISEVLGLKKLDIGWQENQEQRLEEFENVEQELEKDNQKGSVQKTKTDENENNIKQDEIENAKNVENWGFLGMMANQLQIQGKGGKVRTIFLAPVAREAISKYLQERGVDNNPYLFISHSKNTPKNKLNNPKKWSAISPRMVQMMLQKYANRIGVYKTVTPHTLRHSFATKILFEGGDLRSVQTMLGHSNIATTQIYTHITDWQIKELHSKVFNKNKVKTESFGQFSKNSSNEKTKTDLKNEFDAKLKSTSLSDLENYFKNSLSKKIDENAEIGGFEFNQEKLIGDGGLESEGAQEKDLQEKPLENLAKIIRKINKGA